MSSLATPLVSPLATALSSPLIGFSLGTAFGEIFPVSFSQSSVFAGVPAASSANMADDNQTTGTGTDFSMDEFIRADLGSPRTVSTVRVAGGNITGWGVVSPYLNGAVIQSSVDDINWTTQATISGTSEVGGPVDFSFTPVTARYWRISNGFLSMFLSTTEFRLFNNPPAANDNGWFFDTPAASGHLLTSGMI